MEKKIVEIHGVKLEVDLRNAKRIDTFSIGDKIKLLKKKYGDSYVVYPGVIVGFENFRELPTIVIAYLEHEYSTAELKFEYFNNKSEDVDIVPTDPDYLPLEKASVVDKMDKEITKKEMEIQDLKDKKRYFLTHFKKYFEIKE